MTEELRTYSFTTIETFNKKFEGEYVWEVDAEQKDYIRIIGNNVCAYVTQVFSICALHEIPVTEVLRQFKMFTPLTASD
jgi:hypothetical protein